MVVQWLSGFTLALKWHWIGARLFEWLSNCNQINLVVVQWLSGSTLEEVKLHWIGTRLVDWLKQWGFSGTGLVCINLTE